MLYSFARNPQFIHPRISFHFPTIYTAFSRMALKLTDRVHAFYGNKHETQMSEERFGTFSRTTFIICFHILERYISRFWAIWILWLRIIIMLLRVLNTKFFSSPFFFSQQFESSSHSINTKFSSSPERLSFPISKQNSKAPTLFKFLIFHGKIIVICRISDVSTE